jgi:nucleoside-diphosphate-sugar epimerase
MLKSALVLGSAGQIGSSLVSFLKRQGLEVGTFDITTSVSEDLRSIPNDDLTNLISNFDVTIFLAFDVGGSKYLEKHQSSAEFIINNLQIMSNTFSALSRTRKPFIFASSQMSRIPDSSYGILKGIGEPATAALKGITLRFWNVYGLEENSVKAHVISDFIRSAKNSGEIRMRTSGGEKRDFLHVDDACSAIFTVAQKFARGEVSGSLDVAAFKYYSISEVASLVASIVPSEIFRGNKEDSVQNGHTAHPSTDILDFWSPRFDLREGILDIISRLDNSHSQM